jgi:hypothetical protein
MTGWLLFDWNGSAQSAACDSPVVARREAAAMAREASRFM